MENMKHWGPSYSQKSQYSCCCLLLRCFPPSYGMSINPDDNNVCLQLGCPHSQVSSGPQRNGRNLYREQLSPAWVHGCRGAQHSLCSTVSKDSMRDLTVAAGSGSASPLASLGEAGIMQHWSDAGPSSPWDLTDTVNKVVVYARNSQLPPHVGIWFCRLPERMKHC